MTPDIQTMRNYVSKRYDSLRWEARVAEMDDNRVIAIYFRMIEEKPKIPEPEEKEKPDDDHPTLF